MRRSVKILSIDPPYAIPGGEIAIECEGFQAGARDNGCFVGGERCRIVAASSSRVIAIVPEGLASEHTHVHLEGGGHQTEPFPYIVGKRLVGDMHIVANPAIDPTDDALILTRSGARGQQLPTTLFRYGPDGYLDEFNDSILNPTGIAFDRDGHLYVSNRAEGEIYQFDHDRTSTVYATGLGVATGMAFDSTGALYVGDRSGTIFRVSDFAEVEIFTVMEPSVAAYHMAFGPDERLYLTSPGLASHDAVHAVDKEGFDEKYFTGLGRPQGLAFSADGSLYVAACFRGRHGIAKIDISGEATLFAAGPNIVGLCFSRKGEMIVATNDSVYSLPVGIKGTLLT